MKSRSCGFLAADTCFKPILLLQRRFLPAGLLEQDLGHHSLVFVIQQMTMKYRHTFDNRVGEVQDDIHGAANRDIHSIQPRRMLEWSTVLCIGQEVDLVYVERM